MKVCFGEENIFRLIIDIEFIYDIYHNAGSEKLSQSIDTLGAWLSQLYINYHQFIGDLSLKDYDNDAIIGRISPT